jgi:hypothetical protein
MTYARSGERPCNAPGITPIDFLESIMHDDTFSYAIRMKAAKHLAMIAARAPQPFAMIRISDPVSDEYITRYSKVWERAQ